MPKKSDKPVAGDLFYVGFLAADVWVLIHARTGAFMRKPRPNKKGIRETYTFHDSQTATDFAIKHGYPISRGPRG